MFKSWPPPEMLDFETLQSSGVALLRLGPPVVPRFFLFYMGVSLFKLNSRKKGTPITKGSLGNLVGLLIDQLLW